MITLEIVSLAFTFPAVFLSVYRLMEIAMLPRLDLNRMTHQNKLRVLALRGSYPIYRFFEPLLVEIGKNQWVGWIVQATKLRSYIQSGSSDDPFSEDEFIGFIWLRSLVIGSVVAIGFSLLMPYPAAVFLGVLTVPGFGFVNAILCASKRAQRMNELSRRLPAVTDLLAMQLKAGLQFKPAIEMVATEMQDHPIGEEFGKLLMDNEHGAPMEESLKRMSRKLSHPDIKYFVDAILAAKKRGTPLAKILISQAIQMRLKRSERAEKAAGRAQANIAFPGLFIMGACLLILLAPFVLQAVKDNPFEF